MAKPECVDCSLVDQPVAPIIPPKDPVSGSSLPPGGAAGQVLTKATNADGDVIWADGGSGGGSILTDIVATRSVGGVTEGARIPAGTSFADLFHWILAPARTPTLTAPYATLTGNNARSIYGIDETIGSVRFDLTFNRGSIQPAYGTSGYRSGTATSYKIDGRDGQSVTIDMDQKLQGAGKVTITGTVSYNAGDQPRDSAGNNYDTALHAGSVISNGITIERKRWIYSNKNGSFERMPIDQYNASPTEIELRNEDPPNQAAIAFPARAKTIETWDALEKEWEDVSWEWLEEQITIDGMTYWKYTDNRGYRAGERKLRFTW